MGKRVPHANETVVPALHSDTAGKLGDSLEKGLRSKDVKTSSSGDLVPPIGEPNPGKNQTKDNPSGLFDKLRARIQGATNSKKSDPEAEIVEKFLQKAEKEAAADEKRFEAPLKGQLTQTIRLEMGRDKLLVNQKKLTDKVRKILVAIEAQDSYLKNIALKIISRKHQGIVIDLPKKEDDVLASTLEGPLAKTMAKKGDSDGGKKG